MGIGDMRLLRVWYDLRLGTHEVTGLLQTREERLFTFATCALPGERRSVHNNRAVGSQLKGHTALATQLKKRQDSS